jgi:hypothetical protein
MSVKPVVLAWHFTADTLRDGRPIPPVGEWLIHNGKVEMCARGLHASRSALDALQYAPGGTLHRVECEGIVAEDSDKLVCRRRRIVATICESRMDQVLRAFARRCALDVIDKWDAPEVVRRYLETGDESIRAAARAAALDAALDAARAAAWDAARAAAWAAARDAARAAAWDAARDAAGDAARDAAWDAAWDAACAAACAAARDAAWDAACAAACAAARDAAWDAAWAAQRAHLEATCLREIGERQ